MRRPMLPIRPPVHLIISMLSGTAAAQHAAQTTKQPPGKLVWQADFNRGITEFRRDWTFQIGNGCPDLCGWGNNEIQIYTDRIGRDNGNLFIDDGHLVLVARREDDGSFTSARIRTIAKRDFLYGRFEIRATVPSTPGVWPAIWMLPTGSVYGRWPLSGEIDIMESADLADKIQGTLHFGDPWPNNKSNGGQVVGRFDDGFHVFAVEWDPNEIRWFLDGELYHTVTADEWFTDADRGSETAPFDEPFHLVLNIAVGGNFAKQNPDKGQWPQEMRVDWIRVSDLGPE